MQGIVVFSPVGRVSIRFKPSERISARSSMVLVCKLRIRFASGDRTWHWFSQRNAWRQTGWKLLFGSNGGGSGGGLFIICLLTLDYMHLRGKKRKNVKQTFYHICICHWSTSSTNWMEAHDLCCYEARKMCTNKSLEKQTYPVEQNSLFDFMYLRHRKISHINSRGYAGAHRLESGSFSKAYDLPSIICSKLRRCSYPYHHSWSYSPSTITVGMMKTLFAHASPPRIKMRIFSAAAGTSK